MIFRVSNSASAQSTGGSASAFHPEHAQTVQKGFRYDPALGFINTRDPWWLHAWMIVFWAALGALAILTCLLVVKPG